MNLPFVDVFQERVQTALALVCSTLHLTALPPMSSTCVGMSLSSRDLFTTTTLKSAQGLCQKFVYPIVNTAYRKNPY